jgi:hypothetical protein
MDHDNLRKKVCKGKLPDKPNLDKKEAVPSESSRVDELPRDLPNHWKAIPMMKNRPAIFKKGKNLIKSQNIKVKPYLLIYTSFFGQK